ncbi:hypothetical protein EPUS_02577 [Endocarpon pusillum Z07020]|uniref:Uncharacterized protein n=1 Tax=Endocarpon pusillum (strain Z07020 / HMAS-L-300199) TaxID=1263415 RepID=U1GXK9_ENDPU|nr:uncharacterized protein EPUS_02577 [Endocarpon pusillum Z07020]ERF76866.1 hypothetical protein EPUS_02577 [Endocarpon pusillum Z07020]
MRLINTSTGALEEFIGMNIPPDAILSHTWEEEEEEEEVSLRDMSDQSCKSKKGYRKIEMTCQFAAQEGINYAWVDTRCIDKSSSAELTEAINSIPSCIRISGYGAPKLPTPTSSIETGTTEARNKIWSERSKITGIKPAILSHAQPLSSVAVVQKMSWAANRTTTRMEDTAYCLLGIFDINMPLLYGEEEKAFRRLQEEIIRSTPDLSIFAWTWLPNTKNTGKPNSLLFSGVLAKSPLVFFQGISLEKRPGHDWRELSVSNGSIKTQVQIVSERIPGKRGTRYLLPLDCSREPNQLLAVRLRKCGPDQFIREDPWAVVEYSEDLWVNAPKEQYLLTELPKVSRPPESPFLDMSLFIGQTRSHFVQVQLRDELEIDDTWPWGRRFDSQDRLFFVSGDPRWDSGAMRVGANFSLPNGRRKTEVEFECMLYLVGWSSLDISHLQCTVMDYRAHATALKALQSRIAAWDHNRMQVLYQLAYHDIPKTSLAVFKIPGIKASAVVSFTPTVVNDPRICQNRFWGVEFFCEVYEEKYLPQVQHGEWQF